MVISRVRGTGPYYKLQIIDFIPNGILIWAYDSSGASYIRDKYVFLGYLPDGDQGAATSPVYEKFVYSIEGLTREKE